MKTPRPRRTIEFEEATSYRRVGARLIDLFCVVVIWALVAVPLTSAFGDASGDVPAYVFAATAVLVPIAYDTVLLRLFGKTPGKKRLGLRVTNARGERLGWGWCLLRTVALYASLVVVIAATVATATVIGWIVVLGLPKHNRFPHDTMTRSYVLRETKGELQKVAQPAAAVTGPLAGTPFADLERLRADGIISEEEYARKRIELGV
jgi:uncharacterized RDD family membrane protein YckC